MIKFYHNNSKWIIIDDKSLILKFIKVLADNDTKKILDVTHTPKIIPEIIKTSKLPQTSSYRKINTLIKTGFLVPINLITAKNGKKVIKYVTLFDNLKIDLMRNDISIKAQFNKEASIAFNYMRNKVTGTHKESKSNVLLDMFSSIKNYKTDSNSLVQYLEKAIKTSS